MYRLEDETSSTSTFNQGSGIQGHAFQLPSAFYPMPAHSNAALYPMDSFLNQPQPRLFSPYPLDPNIVFGGEPDSNQSSPRSMPSAGSTTYTQPTPLSDATSCRSQSIYQGYGHLPHAYERYAGASKLVYPQVFPPEEHYSPPVHISPSGSGYGVPMPQTPSNDQLPSNQVFPPLSSKEDTALPDPFKTYLLEQFNNPEFADCLLHMEIRGQATTFWLHAVVIAQNPTLKGLLQSVQSFDVKGRKTLVLVDMTDAHLSLSAVTSALRSLYGELLPQESLVINALDPALAYLTIGRMFQMPMFQEIGTTGVLKSLTLDNLEKVISHAIAIGADRGTDTTGTRGIGRYPLFSRRLFEGLLDFVVANFPDPFILDTCAPNPRPLCGYPPVSPSEPQFPRSKPELMSIQFGEFLSASHSIPSAESTAMSSLLLSVTTSVLQQILIALGQSVAREIAGPIIAERERRRLKALEVIAAQEGPAHSTESSELINWEERVVETDSGITITGVYKGTNQLLAGLRSAI